MSQPSEYVTFNGRITAQDRNGIPIAGEVRVTLWCNYPGDAEHKNDDEKTVIVKLDSTGKASWEITGRRAGFRKYDRFGVIFSGSVKCDDLGSRRLDDGAENYDWGDMLFSPISGTLKEGENSVAGRTLYVLEKPFETVSDVWKDNPDKAVMSIWIGDQEEGKFSAHTQTPVSGGAPGEVYFVVYYWGGNPDHQTTTAKISPKITVSRDGSTPEQNINSWTELPFE